MIIIVNEVEMKCFSLPLKDCKVRGVVLLFNFCFINLTIVCDDERY